MTPNHNQNGNNNQNQNQNDIDMMSFLVIVKRFKTIRKLISNKKINDVHIRAKLSFILSKTLDQIRALKSVDMVSKRKKELESILGACQMRLMKNDQQGFHDQIDAYEEWRKKIAFERKRADDLSNAFEKKTQLSGDDKTQDTNSTETNFPLICLPTITSLEESISRFRF